MHAKQTARAFVALTAVLATTAGAQAQAQLSTTDTRLLAQPAVSANLIAFAYAGDLWTAKLDGSDVRRLTTADGDETNPVFSPDGRWIAFSGNYDGNRDVYLVPSAGGEPRRLTWHPGADIPQGFTPDGKRILFTSGRADFSDRYTQLWTVAVEGGPETRLPIPNANQGTYSPDGKSIAYNPIGRAFEQWKGYRGGQVAEIWLIDTGNWAVEKIPQPAGHSNDVDPMWVEPNVVWFRSDRDGEFNLYRYDRGSKQVTRVTNHTDFPVMNASAGAGKVIYEQGGWIYLIDAVSGNSTGRRLTVGVAADLRETRARWVKGLDYVRNGSISPTGARVAVEMRGEIVTVAVEKGDPRNLTNTPGAHERSPAWSPDGTQIAFVSDQGGEYKLHLAPQDGKGAHRVIPLTGAGFYFGLDWSPDGKKIAYFDNAQTIYVLDIATGKCKRVGGNRVYSPLVGISYHWSPDSKWLAYIASEQPLVRAVSIYDVEKDKSSAVTDGLSEVAEPVFDRGGQYLYVLASTDAGPALDWFAQSNAGLRRTRGIYGIALNKKAANLFSPESDEEKVKAAADSSAKAGSDAKEPAPAATVIDFDRIGDRVVAFPVAPAEIEQLAAGNAGQVYYLRRTDGKGVIRKYDTGKKKDDVVIPDAESIALTDDGKKLIYRSGPNFFVTSTEAPKPGEGQINLADVQIRIEPRAEWNQIFDEVWRIQRDYFYATNYHGVDWPAQKVKYGALVASAATRADVFRIVRWLLSELRVGHSFMAPGTPVNEAASVGVGLLGADFDVAGPRYRFTKIYGGLNWTPGLRAPLTEPGVDVRVGDYLLAVNGVDVRTTSSVYAPFENTVGRSVELTVGSDPNGAGSRTVKVVPIANEGGLRNRAWIEGNLHKVDSITGGRVAYVYVPNTAEDGYQSFKRYFYPQAHKDAIIVDERFNGGGSLADYYIEILQRPALSYWAMRYGADLKTPTASIQGPRALLTDETAGSGGDYFPWMFKKLKLGPTIGKRTWGGLVGILGTPVLMDGGFVTSPNLAIWTPEEGYIVENVGISPDIEVEQDPKDVIAGRDPQLERAIGWVMDELKKNPPPRLRRPPYPDKVVKH